MSGIAIARPAADHAVDGRGDLLGVLRGIKLHQHPVGKADQADGRVTEIALLDERVGRPLGFGQRRAAHATGEVEGQINGEVLARRV